MEIAIWILDQAGEAINKGDEMLFDDYTHQRLKNLLDEVSNILDLKEPITPWDGLAGGQHVDKICGVYGLVKRAFDVERGGRNKIDSITEYSLYWSINWSKRG